MMELAHSDALSRQGYTPLRELGRGGMGVVYLARQESLQRCVAIKLLTDSGASDEHLRQRLKKEALLLRDVTHPNVVRVFDILEAPTTAVVFEFIDGAQTLEDSIREQTLSYAEALLALRGVLEGLEAIHGVGIIHRDLKPSNILVTSDGQTKIIDLGIARWIDPDRTRQTQDGAVMGTLSYMPPEQMEGKDVDARADIYAWALVAYETLLGTFVFASTSGPGRIGPHERFASTPPSLVARAPSTNPLISRLVTRCLSPDPASRPQSATHALAEFTRALTQLSESTVAGSAIPDLPRARAAGPRGPTEKLPLPVLAPPAGVFKRGLSSNRSFIRSLQAVAVSLTVAALVSWKFAASPVPSVQISPLSVTEDRFELRWNEAQGGFEFIRGTPPGKLELEWWEADHPKHAEIDLVSTPVIQVEQLVPSTATSIRARVGPRVLDLATPYSTEIANLERVLETLRLRDLLHWAARLIAVGHLTPTSTARLEELVPMRVRSLIARSAPLVQNWLLETSDARRRQSLLTRVYRAEIVDTHLERFHLQPVLGVSSLLPNRWRERLFLNDGPDNPRLLIRQSLGNSPTLSSALSERDPHSKRIVPRHVEEHTARGADWFLFYWLMGVSFVPPRESMSSVEPLPNVLSGETTEWAVEFQLPSSELKDRDELLLDVTLEDLGRSIFWFDINGRIRVPMNRISMLPGDTKQRPLDHERFLPSDVLNPGTNVIRVWFSGYPGLYRPVHQYLNGFYCVLQKSR